MTGYAPTCRTHRHGGSASGARGDVTPTPGSNPGRGAHGWLAIGFGAAVCLLLGLAPLGAQTTPRIVQPGAPGEPTTVLEPEQVDAIELPGFTEADVQFMQGMIPHHAQALDMCALMPDRTSDKHLNRLCERIVISQRDEIALMSRWLEVRGRSVPSGSGHDMGPGMLMPGMLTPGQMEELAAAEGAAFERLFLEYMISHHQGALDMVAELFSTPGAAQESSIFKFASDVDADQEMEIRRMQLLLDELR